MAEMVVIDAKSKNFMGNCLLIYMETHPEINRQIMKVIYFRFESNKKPIYLFIYSQRSSPEDCMTLL